MKFLEKWFKPKGLDKAIATADQRLIEGHALFRLQMYDSPERLHGRPLPDTPALQFFIAASSLALREGPAPEPLSLHDVRPEVREILLSCHSGIWPEDGTRDLILGLFPEHKATIRKAKTQTRAIAEKFWTEAFGPPQTASSQPNPDHERQWYVATKQFDLTPERDLIGFLSDKGPEYLQLMATYYWQINREELFWLASRSNLNWDTAAFIHLIFATTDTERTADERATEDRLSQRLQADEYAPAACGLGQHQREIVERFARSYRDMDRTGLWSLSEDEIEKIWTLSLPPLGPMICEWMSGTPSIHSSGFKDWNASAA